MTADAFEQVQSRMLARFRRAHLAALDEPELGAVRRVVAVLDDCIADLNRRAGFDDNVAFLVRSSVLPGAFPALFSLRHGDREDACAWTVRTWAEQASKLRPDLDLDLGGRTKAGKPLLRAREIEESDREFACLWNVAVAEHIGAGLNKALGRLTLQQLSAHLGLSQDELGRMFRVSGETIRRWKLGKVEIPQPRLAELASAHAALKRLLEIFRPERLPQAIRRSADLFAGRRARDWILDGRIGDVADRYEHALEYQA